MCFGGPWYLQAPTCNETFHSRWGPQSEVSLKMSIIEESNSGFMKLDKKKKKKVGLYQACLDLATDRMDPEMSHITLALALPLLLALGV